MWQYILATRETTPQNKGSLLVSPPKFLILSGSHILTHIERLNGEPHTKPPETQKQRAHYTKKRKHLSHTDWQTSSLLLLGSREASVFWQKRRKENKARIGQANQNYFTSLPDWHWLIQQIMV